MQGAAWWGALCVLTCGALRGDLAAELPPPCDSQIYCTGELLRQVQQAKFFDDDKHFVDMGLRESPENVLAAFQALVSGSPGVNVPRDQLNEFVNRSFNPPGQEFERWDPPDWHENPRILSRISDSELRGWAAELHSLWKSLGRKIKKEVETQPDHHSQIYVPNAFIVPGGRFREFYYWDSYWVINGLLLSEMSNTARGMIENFLYMVERIGFIPNGGRVYYLRRSQPPFLTLMMDSYLTNHNNLTFLRESVPLLEKEYDFWMRNRSVTVTLGGSNHTLNRYHVQAGGPRPESYTDDYQLAENLTEDSRQSLYTELQTAAESGWDFSSRWFAGTAHSGADPLQDTKSSSVIPVDLNAILCRVEGTLAKFYQELGVPEKAQRFRSARSLRLQAVQSLLWDEQLGVWLDYNMDTQRRNPQFYPTNLAPLWAECFPDAGYLDRAVSYLETSGGLSYKNGIPTSLTNSGQQWDFPNAWPPLQHMVMEGLAKSGSLRAQEIAFSLAQNWVRTNHAAYRKYKAMFEKVLLCS
ncbi:trehalase [Ascaphus truei]|uniref:trehalase n=1 Tax=Ascaphus truei TaxID=8439 RepID=UPI003F5903A7